MTIAQTVRRLAAAFAFAMLAAPALAHPHVWVTSKAEFDYQTGRLTSIRHVWTFDEGYSAFVTQGLDTNKDGRFSAEELQALATENTTNLAEFGYFTKLKVGGREQLFSEPREPRMAMDGKQLTLTFLLPLKTPVAQGKGVAALEVYDPTYFVSFGLAEGSDAARLSGAPTGCTASLTRPKAPETKTADAGKPMTEAFFEALTSASAYGAQFANRILVACP